MALLDINRIIFATSKNNNDSNLIDSDFLWYTDSSKKMYFFFVQEINLPLVERHTKKYDEQKKLFIRHLIPHKGKFYDYVVGKHYNTLQEWAKDNKRTINDIRYGVNDLGCNVNNVEGYTSVSLQALMKYLHPMCELPTEQELATEVQNNNKKLVADLRAAIYTVEKQTEYLKNLIAKIE